MQKKLFNLNTIHLVSATFLMAALTTISSLYLPTKITDEIITGFYADRALEWYDEISELSVINSTFYTNASRVSPRSETLLTNMANVAEITLISLYTPKGALTWYSGYGPESQAEIDASSLFSGISTSSDKITAADVKISHVQLPTKRTGIEKSHSFATAIIPDNRSGHTVGLLQVVYDVTRTYEWYKNGIKVTILTIGSVIVLALALASIVNFQFVRAVKKSKKESREREAKITKLTKERRRENQVVREFGEWLQTSRSTDELFELVKTFMTSEANEFSGQLYIYDRNHEKMELASHWGENKHSISQTISPSDCWGMRRGRVYRHGSEQISFHCQHVDPSSSDYFCIPMIANGEAVGLVTLNSNIPNEGIDLEQKSKFVETCIEQISMALSNVMLRDRLEQQSLRDPLTGIQNRRSFEIELSKHTNPGQNVDFVMIDIDHFKSFNDTFGHNAGDHVLQNVCTLLEEEPNCLAFRMGGEEMALLLPRNGNQKNIQRVETIRKKIEEMSLSFNGQNLPTVTASFGATRFPEDTKNPQALVQIADEALYKAKDKGRNCVIWHGETELEETTAKHGPKKLPKN